MQMLTLLFSKARVSDCLCMAAQHCVVARACVLTHDVMCWPLYHKRGSPWLEFSDAGVWQEVATHFLLISFMSWQDYCSS